MTLGLYGLSMQAQITSEAQTCTFWPGFAVINLFIHAQLSQLSMELQLHIKTKIQKDNVYCFQTLRCYIYYANKY